MTSAEAEIQALLGGDPAAERGVIHVSSVVRGADPESDLATIAIGPGAPRSATDRFLLDVARARADAIVTTGRILRAEPALRHDLGGAPERTASLRRWRREHLGKRETPWSVVLTRGAALDLAHPLLRPPARALIVAPERAAREIEPAARARGVRVVGRATPSLEDAISLLVSELGCDTVTIEAGPSTTRRLYEPPARVDELLLSIFEDDGAVPRAAALGTEADFEAALGPPRVSQARLEESGRWTFRRYRRNRLAPSGSDG